MDHLQLLDTPFLEDPLELLVQVILETEEQEDTEVHLVTQETQETLAMGDQLDIKDQVEMVEDEEMVEVEQQHLVLVEVETLE